MSRTRRTIAADTTDVYGEWIKRLPRDESRGETIPPGFERVAAPTADRRAVPAPRNGSAS